LHEAEVFDVRVVGLQANDDTWVPAVRLIAAAAELPLYAAVITAL
jgi:hypothetical protein